MPSITFHAATRIDNLSAPHSGSSRNTETSTSRGLTLRENPIGELNFAETPIAPVISNKDIPLLPDLNTTYLQKKSDVISETTVSIGFPKKTRFLESDEPDEITIKPGTSKWVIIKTPLILTREDKHRYDRLRGIIEAQSHSESTVNENPLVERRQQRPLETVNASSKLYATMFGIEELFSRGNPNASYKTAVDNRINNQPLFAISSSKSGTLIAFPYSEISRQVEDAPVTLPNTSNGPFKQFKIWEWMTTPDMPIIETSNPFLNRIEYRQPMSAQQTITMLYGQIEVNAFNQEGVPILE
ncbi:hypothetical protein HOG98_05195 [bacterium]|jgi:hypothetical protein|nr:hypothetical protein [bacterium]